MVRALDANDQYQSKSAGHPSDVIPGILAVAEMIRADGRSVINAINLAYEIYCSFCDAIDVNSKGWDLPVYDVMACSLAVGRLIGLSHEQLGNALSLALTPNLALWQVRNGELSQWKGCASANGVRNAVFAVFLAQSGFTGPTAVFEGEGGLYDIVGKFEWDPAVRPGGIPRVLNVNTKFFPLEYHGQSPLWATLELSPKVQPDDIVSVRVDTYRVTVERMANDPSRWAPRNRETADHSLPYTVGVGLMDGEITARSFSEERLHDQKLLALVQKVQVCIDPEMEAKYPKALPCRLTVTLASGEVLTAEVAKLKGHFDNALTDGEIASKFSMMFKSYGNKEQERRILERLWSFEEVEDFSEVVDLLTRKEE
jgi:2-methylcitrate dehydratase